MRSSEGWKAKSKPASVLIAVSRAISERRLDAAVLAHGEFLDEQLVEGFDAVDLALLDAAQGGVEHLERARHPAAPTRLRLDAVERCGGSVGHEPTSDPAGETLADGLIEGERAPGDVIAPAADDDAADVTVAQGASRATLTMAGSIRYCRRPSRTGWVATRRPPSRMRIMSGS